MRDSSLDFFGGVFSDKIEGGRTSAKISIGPQGIAAETLEEQRFEISYGECQLDKGGATGRMIFCRNEDRSITLFCEERGFSKALETQSLGLLSPQMLAINKKQGGHEKSFWFWLSIASVVTLVAGVVGYYALIAATQAAVTALPISFDDKIGSVAIKSVDLHARLDAGHVATKMVNDIVKELEPFAATKGLDFRVTVVDEPTVNAFALPGGQIVVYAGLIKKAKSPEQLAGVLAHEMSHATLRHGLKGVGQSLGIVAAIQLVTGDVGGLLALSSQLAQESILTSYSRQSETEADLEGARMLHEAGIDPKHMAEFFGELHKLEGDIPDVLAWISTHPQHADRVAKIENYQLQIPRKAYRLLELPWEEVQNQLGN